MRCVFRYYQTQKLCSDARISVGRCACEIQLACVPVLCKFMSCNRVSGEWQAYKVKPLVDADGKNVVLKLGDGSKDKPLKIEWASQKGGKLVVGSTGKERTDDDSCVVHHGEMWVKILEPGTFSVTNIDGTQAFNGLRASANVGPAPAVGEKSAGYMIHESGRWSDVHGRWFFLPRKLSRGTYDEIADASKCVNLMLSGPDFAPGAGINNDYADCLVQPYLGFLELRGCSDFLFVPGTNDCHLFVMRTEESLDGVISTYSSVIDLQGRVLMRESKIAEDRKFEGAAWVGGWASFVGPGAPPSAPGGGCPVQ
jgi:soluble calcium-activated nucleotidase 1